MHLFAKRYQHLLLLPALLFISSWATADTDTNYTPTDPAYVIHTTLKKITNFSSHSDKVNPLKLRGFIENEIIPHFDFNNMSHWITGRYARNMSDQDKSDFQRNLRETFLSSLSKHLGSFDAKNTRVRFYPARYRGPAEAFVSTSIYRPESLPVRLDFRMKLDGGSWKIIDVKANGSSGHFISQLRRYQKQH
jgi:phospholipid transport system substrate-binding protein